jgi:uncharacterized protein (DUF305 family)
MIEKSTLQAGVICGIICVAFMWAYMSLSHSSMMMPSQSAEQQGMHLMPDGSYMNDSHMSGMMMDMTARLKGKTSAELEKIFLEDMIVHHQGAVDMSKELLKGTNRPELIQFANDIISAQSKEIDMQKKWLKEWYSAE